MSFIGLFFVLVVLFFPRGVLGILRAEGRAMSLLRGRATSSRHFGSLVAVDGVSMTVEPGELRAVIGPNGAGKTTFFNLISGFFPPTSGRILFDGEDITDLLPARRVWRGIARTFQITEVFPELTVRENLRIAVEVGVGLSAAAVAVARGRRQVRGRVDELLDMSGLDRQGRPAGRRAAPRRPARHRNHDGAGA